MCVGTQTPLPALVRERPDATWIFMYITQQEAALQARVPEFRRQIKINFTPANSSTNASTRRIISESNRLAPSVEPTTPPTTAAAIHIQTLDCKAIT